MDIRRPLDSRAVSLMLLLCLVWSLQQISLKAVAHEASAMLMIGIRSGLAALLVYALMLWRGERVSWRGGHWRPGFVVGALFAFEYLLVAEALRLTHASHVVVFLYTAPIFAALGLHWRLPAERLHGMQWLGIVLAFTGIVVAFLGGGSGHGDASARDILLGDLLALLGGAAWGATTVTIRCSALSSAPATETLLYQLVAAFLLLVPSAYCMGEWRFDPTPQVLSHLLFHAVVVCFASFLIWFWLLRQYLASRLGVFSFMTPVFGVVLGVWLLNEPLTASFIAGGGLVLAGVLLVSGDGWLRQLVSRRRSETVLNKPVEQR